MWRSGWPVSTCSFLLFNVASLLTAQSKRNLSVSYLSFLFIHWHFHKDRKAQDWCQWMMKRKRMLTHSSSFFFFNSFDKAKFNMWWPIKRKEKDGEGTCWHSHSQDRTWSLVFSCGPVLECWVPVTVLSFRVSGFLFLFHWIGPPH